MTKAYKEDPHWFGVTGFLMGVGGRLWAELVGGSRSGCPEYGGWLVFLQLLTVSGSSHSLWRSTFVSVGLVVLALWQVVGDIVPAGLLG